MASTTNRKGRRAERTEVDLNNVPTTHWPSQPQKELWWDWVDKSSMPDDWGWWWGWCPLHSQAKGEHTAQFNFSVGTVRCLAVDDKGRSDCMGDRKSGRPKQAMSLTNMQLRLATIHAKRA